MDSELLVKQIKRVYRIKSANLKPLWEKAQHILKQLDSYRVTHVQRELNKEADSLAKKAIKFMR
jgi:ribonuclease HI